MKKTVVSLLFVTMMVLSANIATAMQNPLQELTGKVWMNSSLEAKKALIYGVSCAVAMEFEVAKRTAEKAGQSANTADIVKSLFAFSENWILAFRDVSIDDIVTTLDNWYKNNSTQLDRPVFDVLWHEVMEPRLK